jgi:CheY-like chemotaxis protein
VLTLLVADDEFAVLEVLSMALEGEGHRVLKASDGADAWRLLLSQPCDALVCDEAMPMMDGPALVAAIRKEPRLADLPIVMMVETLGKAKKAIDGVTVLPKPVRLADLVAAVAQIPQRRTKP